MVADLEDFPDLGELLQGPIVEGLKPRIKARHHYTCQRACIRLLGISPRPGAPAGRAASSSLKRVVAANRPESPEPNLN